MGPKAFASNILRELAETRRRVISDWRIHVIARHVARAENAPLPDEEKAQAIRKELVRRGEVGSAEGVSGVYVVNVAYANLLEVSEEQIIQEANPWAVFGFLTAMAYHGITDLVPTEVYPIASKGAGNADRLPLGTTPEDWSEESSLLTAKRPPEVRGVRVNWTQLSSEPGFGVIVGYSFGVPIYVTDVERTLLDAIRMPEKSGGIEKVLQAWRSAEKVDVDKLVSYADEYGHKVLRQRVGFLLEKLGKTHPLLAEWRHGLQRGGSVKLVARNPYAATFSAKWNLSLNVPESVRAILEEN
jgi:predicted transcriptional regulator of viral defense system